MNPEDLLTRSLHEQAERADYPSTPLTTVVRRARGVRRRRAGVTALAAAAAVAVVVTPTAVWLNRSPGSSSGPSSKPSSASPSASHDQQRQTLAQLPLGPKPGIDYLVGNTYVEMGSGHETAPILGRATSVALGRGGILVATPRGIGPADISLVTGQTSQTIGCGANAFAITPDRVMTAYWLADSCTHPSSGGRIYTGVDNTMGNSGAQGLATPKGLLVQPVGMLRADVLANASYPGGSPAGAYDFGDGIAPRRVPGLRQASGVSPDGDQVSGTLTSGAGAVVDTLTGKARWTSDTWQPGQFSQDGRYVLARQSRNGPIPDAYAVLDARTGAVVIELGPFPALPDSVRGVAWEDQDDVLAVVWDGSGEAIVRYDLQGHARRTTPVIDVSGSNLGYRLATRP